MWRRWKGFSVCKELKETQEGSKTIGCPQYCQQLMFLYSKGPVECNMLNKKWIRWVVLHNSLPDNRLNLYVGICKVSWRTILYSNIHYLYHEKMEWISGKWTGEILFRRNIILNQGISYKVRISAHMIRSTSSCDPCIKR